MVTLVKLKRCSSWRQASIIELNRSYDKMLSRFTSNPAEFRGILRRTGAIVSGSAALWFLFRLPVTWKAEDMEIFTPYGTLDEVVLLFEDLLGHHAMIPNTEVSDTLDFPFARRSTFQTDSFRIDIIESQTNSPFSLMTSYWSTHIMNALTADTFWSAYPSLTLRKIGIYTFNEDGGCGSLAMENYSKQGFKTFRKAEKSWLGIDGKRCDGYVACPRRNRLLGDCFTLKLTMSQISEDNLNRALNGACTIGWILGSLPCGTDRCLVPGEHKSLCLPLDSVLDII